MSRRARPRYPATSLDGSVQQSRNELRKERKTPSNHDTALGLEGERPPGTTLASCCFQFICTSSCILHKGGTFLATQAAASLANQGIGISAKQQSIDPAASKSDSQPPDTLSQTVLQGGEDASPKALRLSPLSDKVRHQNQSKQSRVATQELCRQLTWL